MLWRVWLPETLSDLLLTVFDQPIYGVTVNGEEILSGDFNANIDNEESIVVELVFTELDAVISEPIEETKRSPVKKLIQRWESKSYLV